MTLDELQTGQSARITRVGMSGTLRQHFLDMGVLPGARVTLVQYAPMGDPMELRVHNYELTLRRADAAQIEIDPTAGQEGPEGGVGAATSPASPAEIPHPGLGEPGPRFHREGHTPPLAGPLTFALAGNQNCGKTTLFNQLTGANQHVGNFPGVTVDRKEGRIKGHPEATVVDLPGIYSLSPYSSEEVISRRFILKEHPHGIINIVDASNIERNLYLTLQLMELGIPMVLCLNMMDEVENNGGTIRINEMEQALGIPVVPISAMKNEGVDEVVTHALHVARYQEPPVRQDFCDPQADGGAVHRALHAIMHLIEERARRAGLPLRFAATKLAEGDRLVELSLRLSPTEREAVEHILRQMEQERGLDRQAALADMRFAYIRRLCAHTVVHPAESKEHRRSRRIDALLTGRWTALPAFAVLMGLTFWLTFNSLGAWLQGLAEDGIAWFTALTSALLTRADIAPAVHSLIIDGIYSGVGTVLVFLPLIVLLFFFLSLMEDSGYMARIAFVTDGLLRKLGLSGRSIVPLLLGFGCTVPSVMSTRTLPSERDRRLTILLTPFMSCTAKIPIYAFFAAAFFPGRGAWVMMGLYLLGILMGILTSTALNRTLFRGEAVPFVMELPNYRLPVAANVARLLWDKARDFLQRAFTVIFLASMAVWFLQNFDFHLQLVGEGGQERSMLAWVASMAAPLFEPLGFGDWRIVTSLVSGFLAKEAVVGTLGTLFDGVMIQNLFPTAAALSLLVFSLLYTPCVAAVAAIRRELGTRWALGIALGQCLLAWVAAFVVYQVMIAL